MAAQLSGISTKSNDVQFSKVPLKSFHLRSLRHSRALSPTLTMSNVQKSILQAREGVQEVLLQSTLNTLEILHHQALYSVMKKSLFLNSCIDKRRSLRCKEDSLRNPVFSKTCKIEMLLHLFLLETLGQLFSSVVNIHKMLQTQSQGAPLVDLRR